MISALLVALIYIGIVCLIAYAATVFLSMAMSATPPGSTPSPFLPVAILIIRIVAAFACLLILLDAVTGGNYIGWHHALR